jgi:hypothetical protein
MTRKEIKKRIREEVAADQARYDEVTRFLRARIEHHRRRAESQATRRRESS